MVEKRIQRECEIALQDIRRFMDESPNGVVIVSLDSLARADVFPVSQRSALVGALAKIPARVIFKWDADYPLPDQTDDFMVLKRLPQRDILGERNIRRKKASSLNTISRH